MIIYFIRHSEPNYTNLTKDMNYQWANLAPLTKEGENLAYKLREQEELKNGIILSSPYTRAFQTASIFANGKPIIIEKDLHEWLPSKSFHLTIGEFHNRLSSFKKNEKDYDYETCDEMVNRMNTILHKYKNENTLIIFSHSKLITTYLNSIGINQKHMNYCQIIKIERTIL